MSDLIDKRQALELIRKVREDTVAHYGKRPCKGFWELTAVMGMIANMPTVQQLETCPIYGGVCGYPSDRCYECPRHEKREEAHNESD